MADLAIPKSAQVVAIQAVELGLPADMSDVWVSDQVPSERRPRMVRISRSPGGGMEPHGATDRALLVVECWADSVGDAEELANTVRAVLRNAVGHRNRAGFIRYWRENSGPYEWPDESRQPRWQFTGELHVKIG